jgi:peptidoglycan lytic transglycosylase G
VAALVWARGEIGNAGELFKTDGGSARVSVSNGSEPRYQGSSGPTSPPRSARAALQPEEVRIPSRSRRARHPLVMIGNAIFTILILLSIAAGATYYFGRERFKVAGPLPQEKVVNIPRGLGFKEISDVLAREGVIDQPYVFMGAVVAMKARGELKSGEYRFTPHASVADVVETLMEGKVVQHALTLAEGLTSEQIVARLQENDVLTGQITHIPPEGTLLPETYKFTRGTTRAGDPAHAAGGKARAAGDLGPPRSRIAAEVAAGIGDARLNR